MLPHQKEGMGYGIFSVIIALVLVIMLCSCSPSYGQSKKDSIPPKKQYVFVIDPQGYHTLDSILFLSCRVAGYELPTKESDGLKSGLGMIINFLRQTVAYQDSVYNSVLQKPKK